MIQIKFNGKFKFFRFSRKVLISRSSATASTNPSADESEWEVNYHFAGMQHFSLLPSAEIIK
jgi:hypothetical protein